MVFVIRVYQLITLLLMGISIFRDKFCKKKDDKWMHLSLAKWVFYFGAIESFILCFGVAAEVESLLEISWENIESILLILLFLIAVVFGSVMMFVQKMWHIKYDDNTIIFRNSFGFSKVYKNEKVFVRNRKEMTQLFIDDIKITQWDNRLMNMYEEIQFERSIQKPIEKQPSHAKKRRKCK